MVEVTSGFAAVDALAGEHAAGAAPPPPVIVVVAEEPKPAEPPPEPKPEPEPPIKTETKPGEVEMSVGDFPQQRSKHVAATPQAPLVAAALGIAEGDEAPAPDEEAAKRYTQAGHGQWRNAALQLPHEHAAAMRPSQAPVVATPRTQPKE